MSFSVILMLCSIIFFAEASTIHPMQCQCPLPSKGRVTPLERMRKVPNVLWPPPRPPHPTTHFRKIIFFILFFFYQFCMPKKPCLKVINLQHKFLDCPPSPMKLFPKIHLFWWVTCPKIWNTNIPNTSQGIVWKMLLIVTDLWLVKTFLAIGKECLPEAPR